MSRSGLLRAGVSAAALAVLSVAGPAWAQDTQAESAQDQDSGDEIVVKGYRDSLQSAQKLKKDSDVIVDSVTAEDISALPDRSVTEALQRIPGVSINRFAAGVDPDHFSVEGSGVVVRGLTYVMSEFNGRETFSANNGRALSFADVPSEMLGGVDVFKSPSADHIEGGISGVVNLRTRRPFDAKGFTIAASAEANYGDFVKKWAPTGSFLISNRWETGVGEFGVLANVSYSRLKTRADRFQLSSFRLRNIYSDGDVVQNTRDASDIGGAAAPTTITGSGYFPRGAVEGTQEFDRERYGYGAAVQWRSNDGSMEALLQFLRSDARQEWTERTIEIATDNVAGNGDSRRVVGTTLAFDSDKLFSSGTITGPTGWRADQFTGAARVPMLGLQSNNIRRDQQQKLVTDDIGFNFKWDVNERLGLKFDYQHVRSTTDLLDNTLWISTYQNAFIQLNGSKFPTVQFTPPQVCSGPSANATNPPGGDNDCAGFGSRPADVAGSQYSPAYYGAGHNSFADPFNSFYRAAMDHIEQSDGNSDAFRLDLEYSFPDNNFLKSVQVGGRYADRDQTARFSTYNWGALSEQWGNNGPIWLDTPVNGDSTDHSTGTPIGGWEAYGFPNFFRGSVANPLNGQPRLFYAGDTVGDYAGMIRYANMIVREWTTNPTGGGSGWVSLANRPGVVAGTPFLPGEINPIREKNWAGYAMARIDSEFSNGWRLTGNVGVRYTTTDRTSSGTQSFLLGNFPTDTDCAAVVPPNDPPPFCTFSVAVRNQARAWANGANIASTVKTNYNYWLPSMNLKLEVGGGVQFRAAYFKGVAPPQTGYIRNFYPLTLAPVQNVNANGQAIPGSYTLQATATVGNPYLKPTTADNFDLTAEWYFSDVGQVTLSGFYKRLHGVLTNTTERLDFTNAGQTFSAVVTTPGNSPDTGKILGFEVAYQQTFDFLPGFLKGLGLQANYTYVHSSGVPQSTLSSTDPDVGAGRVTTINTAELPLQGLSKHTLNITPFIDIGPFSARATYSWRSDFLLTVRDVIVPYDPIFNEATGQLDASVFFAITPNIKVGIQGSNLLNEVTRTTAAIDTDTDPNTPGNIRVPRGWYMNDRRFSGIVRFNF
ncbi:TonB-dependent receptor [Sphingomonas canadensis]|nr:TonB-dependent receptor [Sphingomonas canadensis]